MSTSQPRETRVLELDCSNKDGQLLKLKTGWVLRFKIAPRYYASEVCFKTDYPAPGHLYERNKMREIPWIFSTKKPTWDPDRYIDIELEIAGPYRFTYTAERPGEKREGSGYFVVDPYLGYSPDSIACQTYITKLLGPLSEWKQRLMTAKEAGYNMVHFTPVQHLGSSRSAYSISNQLKIDSNYVPGQSHSETTVSFTNCEGVSKQLKVDSRYLKLREIIKSMQDDWGVLSIVDLVWNHTSFDTPWLMQHPEAGYNLVNSPHLRPAYALDAALAQFSQEIVDGKWEHLGIRPEIQHEGDVHNICSRLLDNVLPRARLWEYFCVDVDAIAKEFRTTVYRLNGGNHPRPHGKRLSVIQDTKYRRLGSGVDINETLDLFNIDWPGIVVFEERIERCCQDLREELKRLNREIESHVQDQLQMAVANLAANIRYQFLEGHGPQRKKVTASEPLFPRYFNVIGGSKDLNAVEMESQRGEYVLAHNGWVMNADPLINFAGEGSQVYFQRELIVWGDSIKLRYGNCPEDSPWLWGHMKLYTQTMAWIFQGFRLDNCHNTPIVVAEGLLDAAREVNPNLYLVAELFTATEERDNYYVNRLGINSLVREAMFAGHARELGRLVFKYGGVPVASFLAPNGTGVLKPTTAHAMFMDATHDNDPGHILSRSVYDVLPNTALVTIASCANGGCRGYDELVPHMINVVKETRPYTKWNGSPTSPEDIGVSTGIMAAKKELNTLHKELAEEGFNQIYVDQVTEEIVAVTRHCPSTHQSMILMAHTAFRHPEEWAVPTESKPRTHYAHVPPLTVPGVVKEVVLEARLVRKDQPGEFARHASVINGLQSHVLDMRTHIQLGESEFCHLASGSNGNTQEVVFSEFPPGSIIVFRVSLVPQACSSVKLLRSFLGRSVESAEGRGLQQRLSDIANQLNLLDLNYALYRCDAEERDDGHGGGCYVVPGAGALVYCGLQGIMSMLADIRDNNDLGHPLCDNLRDGDWMAGYTVNRLKLRPGTKQLGDILSVVFNELSKLPRYLIPCYFEAIISLVYDKLVQSAVTKMGKFVQNGSSFIQSLALGSVQLCGVSSSAQLPPSSPDDEPTASLAAGLPHFSTGFMRCWGRDTFIALRGLLIVTERYDDAWSTILSFAACIRHGLIPNLLSGGVNPRYNCRDAPWWWLQSVQDYCLLAPNGYKILDAEVRKLFPNDDSPAAFDSEDCVPLKEIVQEVLQSHYQGIEFRERGAGGNLDKDMTPPGFNIRAGVDKKTGLVYGGSVHNCGTWMDKVGESSWAGNKGVPSTPRDGSAVELQGLCYSAVNWLAKLHQKGIYPHSGVRTISEALGGLPKTVSFSEWGKQLRDNFESLFWIPNDRGQAEQREGQESGYIHRTGMYKDCVGATQRYSDYQLRPNFPIAMVVSPDLFTPQNAWDALGKIQELLLGPLGLRTLDPHDYVYNGYYINSVDSSNYNTARGFNYHQGPEWLWVIGYYLRAKLHFARRTGVPVDDTITELHHVLSRHAQALRESPWKGLPELTNRNGEECADSCPVQAWSMATLLEVFYDIQQQCKKN